MQSSDISPHEYTLATGERAADRLLLLNEIFGPDSEDLLRRAGLSAGMHVAEIGCGSGLVSLWIANVVGASGAVAGVDMSGEQVEVAARNASAAGLKNVMFHQASAYETNLPRGTFDLVYSRFLMCHVCDPAKALMEMRTLLKPGGILVCEDHDDGGIFTEPRTNAYKRLVEISAAVNQAHGLDAYVGLRLPQLVRQAGFDHSEVRVNQIAFLRGRAKHFWEMTLREATPAIIAAGASTQEELDSICAEMQAIAEDDSILLMLARVTQVWARNK